MKQTTSPIPLPRQATLGPLVVSTANPRYFTIQSDNDAEQRVVYLTGSHIWNNFHDGLGPGHDCVDPPEQNDYNAYLDFLGAHGHNFIRLWRWEQFRSQAAGGSFHLCMTPQPWPRSGSATVRGVAVAHRVGDCAGDRHAGSHPYSLSRPPLMLHESVKRDNRHERTRQHTPSATGLSTDRTGDMQSLLNLLAADVQWQVPEMEHVPFAGTWQGHAGIKQFFFTVAEVQETIEFEPQEFIAQEDKMVVLGRFVMRIKATGNTVRSA